MLVKHYSNNLKIFEFVSAHEDPSSLSSSVMCCLSLVMQRVKDEVQRRKKQCNLSSSHNNDHDEFHARLSPARFQDSPLQPKLLVNGHLCDDRS